MAHLREDEGALRDAEHLLPGAGLGANTKQARNVAEPPTFTKAAIFNRLFRLLV
jgi:hypothetical protein